MVEVFSITTIVARKFPSIKDNLRIAHNKNHPEKFIAKSLRITLYVSITLTFLSFLLFGKTTAPAKLAVLMILVFALSYFFVASFTLQSPKGAIRQRQREIDREVLFAGRFLLIKIESGTPLMNTLADAAKMKGFAAKYFKEIVDDINTGTPLEKALDNARTYNASEKFKRILWQIVTALKTGAEVSDTLRGTLRAVAAEQLIDIKRYGKKLNSLMLFYMVLAIVVPSLGLTMLIIISGFVNFVFNNFILFTMLFFISVIQLAFIIMIKAARPTVEL